MSMLMQWVGADHYGYAEMVVGAFGQDFCLYIFKVLDRFLSDLIFQV